MSPLHVLAIDVGNSRIKAGLIAPIKGAGLPECAASIAFPVSEAHPAAKLREWLAEEALRPEHALIGGANPQAIASLISEWPHEVCGLAHIARPSDSILVNRTVSPGRVGPDRLFDAVAASRLRAPGTSALVVDSGTATTINWVDAEGAFRGGAIVAGFELMASALHERTALLPKLDVASLSMPDPLGCDTESAIRSGLYWGLVGGVKELVARLSKIAEEEDSQPPIVLLTGGASPLLAPHLSMAEVHPHLTLQGIALCDS